MNRKTQQYKDVSLSRVNAIPLKIPANWKGRGCVWNCQGGSKMHTDTQRVKNCKPAKTGLKNSVGERTLPDVKTQDKARVITTLRPKNRQKA